MKSALAVLAAVLATAPAGLASPATTAPGARIYLTVRVTDNALVVNHNSSAARGEWIVVHVMNRSKTTGSISLLGATSRRIAPNHAGSFAVFAARRGAFSLVASLDASRRLRRTFVVF